MTMAGEAAGKTAPIPVKKTTTPDAKAGEKAGGSPHASPSHSAHRPSMGGGMKKKVETYAMPDKPKKPGEGAFGSAGFGTIHGMFPEDPARMIVRVGARGHGMSNCDGPRHALAGLVHGAHQEPDGDEDIPESRLLNGGDGDGDEIGPLARKGHGFGFVHGYAGRSPALAEAQRDAGMMSRRANQEQTASDHTAASNAHERVRRHLNRAMQDPATSDADVEKIDRELVHHTRMVDEHSRLRANSDMGRTGRSEDPGTPSNPAFMARLGMSPKSAAKEKDRARGARKALPTAQPARKGR